MEKHDSWFLAGGRGVLGEVGEGLRYFFCDLRGGDYIDGCRVVGVREVEGEGGSGQVCGGGCDDGWVCCRGIAGFGEIGGRRLSRLGGNLFALFGWSWLGGRGVVVGIGVFSFPLRVLLAMFCAAVLGVLFRAHFERFLNSEGVMVNRLAVPFVAILYSFRIKGVKKVVETLVVVVEGDP